MVDVINTFSAPEMIVYITIHTYSEKCVMQFSIVYIAFQLLGAVCGNLVL